MYYRAWRTRNERLFADPPAPRPVSFPANNQIENGGFRLVYSCSSASYHRRHDGVQTGPTSFFLATVVSVSFQQQHESASGPSREKLKIDI